MNEEFETRKDDITPESETIAETGKAAEAISQAAAETVSEAAAETVGEAVNEVESAAARPVEQAAQTAEQATREIHQPGPEAQSFRTEAAGGVFRGQPPQNNGGVQFPRPPQFQNYGQPDYRSAYGQVYDPYAGQRDPEYANQQQQYRPAGAPQPNGPGVHTYMNSRPAGYYPPEAYASHRSAEPQKTEKKKSGSSTKRAVAWMVALCILCSAIFGVGGVYVGSRLFSGGVNKDYGKVNYSKGDETVPTADGTISTAAAIASDTVVEITTEKVSTSSFFGQYVQSGAGSGVIISEDGRIITCAHVVEGATTITVRLSNGDSFEARVLGSDSRTDIAVIKIDATGLSAAKIGDSDGVIVGQAAIVIGNPLGTLGGTVTSGTISALNREITIEGQNYSLLQTDASINPGNSGGGLFDINGNLIGIVNAKSGSSGTTTTIEGLGFAIPINTAIEVAEQLSEKGYVSGRVNLGIYIVEINASSSMTDLYKYGYSELADYITDYGVYFVRYQPGQNGDFQYGDRIIAIDDISVTSRSDIQALLEDYSIGDSVKVTVSRLNSDKRRAQVVEITVNLVEYVPETGDDGTKN